MNQNKSFTIATAAFCLLLTACSDEPNARKAVLAELKDPDSAKFGEFTKSEDSDMACYTVNAKNSLGGYIGNQEAFIMKI
jgi:hypothetical protein